MPSLSVLDLQDNKVEDISKTFCDNLDVLEAIFEKLPNLAVLYFQNNPAFKNIKNYRKTFINNIKTLKYLDDKPVFPEERSKHFNDIKGFCEAFALGGLEAEREERAKYKKEQEDAHLANHIAFREMINRHRIDEAERLRAEQAQ